MINLRDIEIEYCLPRLTSSPAGSRRTSQVAICRLGRRRYCSALSACESFAVKVELEFMPSQFRELRCVALSEFFCCFACSPAGKPADAQEWRHLPAECDWPAKSQSIPRSAPQLSAAKTRRAIDLRIVTGRSRTWWLDCVRRLPAVARPERNAIHGPPLTAIWLSLATSQWPVRSGRVSSFASRQKA
jgi:hypothetical protein